MTASQDKLSGIKPGDRVRITMEGRIETLQSPGSMWIMLDNSFETHHIIRLNAQQADTFQIERIEPPLKVGDRVTWGSKVNQYELLAIVGERGVLWGPLAHGFAKSARDEPLFCLERIA